MNFTDELSQFEPDSFARAMIAARRKASRAFHLRQAGLDEEHERLETAQDSPFIADFERNYRVRIALGRISFSEAIEKIRSASWVPEEVTAHIEKHVTLSPLSAEEISHYEELEAEKELRRLEAQARKQEAAMADFARTLRRLERTRTPRSHLDDLREVKVRGKVHHCFDRRRRRSVKVRDYVRRVKISKAMLARRRLES